MQDIELHLESGRYDRAMTAVRAALSEFPSDPELHGLEEQVQSHQQKAARAQDLLNQARVRNEADKHEESLALLREARQLDSRSSIIRTVFLNSLLAQAQELKDAGNWDGAEGLV
jgi:tetratricopeptide (TPR) repeat protein